MKGSSFMRSISRACYSAFFAAECVRGRPPILARSHHRRFSGRRHRRLRGHFARRAAARAVAEEGRSVHGSVRPHPGRGARRRSVLRHWQRRKGLPVARPDAEADLHGTRAGDLLRRRSMTARSTSVHRRTERSIASIPTTEKRASSTTRSRRTSGRWRFCPTATSSLATGVDGKLLPREPARRIESAVRLSGDAPAFPGREETTARCSSADRGRGGFTRCKADGSAHALYDSSLNEISHDIRRQ